jgi:hypothetical protein
VNSKLTFTWEQARQVVENHVFAHFGEPLKEIQLSLLQDVWEGLTYSQIAQKRYLSVNYLRGDLGPKLWQKLSLALGQEVTKTNFKALLEAVGQTDQDTAGLWDTAPPVRVTTDWLFSAGSVPPASPFYQERRCDDLGWQALQQPGSLLQVRSPRGMGKTSLVNQLLYRMKLQAYPTILFDLQSLEADWLSQWELFLRWFCLSLRQQFNPGEDQPLIWEPSGGSPSEHSTQFLATQILPYQEQPWVLAVDGVERVFAYPETLEKWLRLLRHWHELMKTSPLWQSLRILLSYSTSDRHFCALSPQLFQFGMVLELEDFQVVHLQRLMHQHQLQLSDEQIARIMDMIGGHPYLIRQFFHQLTLSHLSLEQLLETAPTQSGIYSEFLYQLGYDLQFSPELIQTLKRLVQVQQPLTLTPTLTYSLYHWGFIKKQGNQVVMKYPLYRQYFRVIEHLIYPSIASSLLP